MACTWTTVNCEITSVLPGACMAVFTAKLLKNRPYKNKTVGREERTKKVATFCQKKTMNNFGLKTGKLRKYGYKSTPLLTKLFSNISNKAIKKTVICS